MGVGTADFGSLNLNENFTLLFLLLLMLVFRMILTNTKIYKIL